jgi:hypothetical protein
MRRRDYPVEVGAGFVRALREKHARIPRRIKLLEPPLGEQQQGRDLRRPDDTEKRQGAQRSTATK